MYTLATFKIQNIQPNEVQEPSPDSLRSQISLRSNVSPLNWGKFSGPGAAETKYVQNSPQKLDVLMNFKTKSAIV